MIAIGSDHGGLQLKDAIRNYLVGRGLTVDDLGTNNEESVDYPDFGARVAQAVSSQAIAKGILICGTGIGMSIAANKFPGIRAALVWDDFTAQMAKEHNDANILVLGGRVLAVDDACRMVGIWLDTAFAGGRHQGRLDKIAQIEEDVRHGRL
ncbi:MAG: ribose 5-phosphate isomerase B [Deltaproteobacteria bacterium HGW-Deltaproteobacteria-4]|nr:MAG: ribose 5-phosphate isomerase B [Deltaproteobacteria bacterium HGW-Deltaproteobacteria-4]